MRHIIEQLLAPVKDSNGTFRVLPNNEKAARMLNDLVTKSQVDMEARLKAEEDAADTLESMQGMHKIIAEQARAIAALEKHRDFLVKDSTKLAEEYHTLKYESLYLYQGDQEYREIMNEYLRPY